MSSTNMMICHDYVPEWGKREALRELVANAKDADPDYKVEITFSGITIKTVTEPSYTELLLLGAGSKKGDTANSSTIGQFGEGSKLAALALTRLGADLVITTSLGRITFTLEQPPELDRPTLHVHIDREAALSEKGCVVTFRAIGLRRLYNELFLPIKTQHTYGPIEKKYDSEEGRIYCHGVKIISIQETCHYHWNLDNLKLNRDRTFPNIYDVRRCVGDKYERFLLGNEWRRRLALFDDSSFEACSIEDTFVSYDLCQAFKETFHELHGQRAVLSNGDPRVSYRAESKNYKVVTVAKRIEPLLKRAGVQSAEAVLTTSEYMSEVSRLNYVEEIKELERLGKVINIDANIRVFKAEEHEALLGLYKDKTIWLSTKLFEPDQRNLRIGTYLHEAGHHLGGGDISTQFEQSLEKIAAILAINFLSLEDTYEETRVSVPDLDPDLVGNT